MVSGYKNESKIRPPPTKGKKACWIQRVEFKVCACVSVCSQVLGSGGRTNLCQLGGGPVGSSANQTKGSLEMNARLRD